MCNDTVSCNGSQPTCNNDIKIIDENLVLLSSPIFHFEENFVVENSKLNLSSIELFLNKSLTFTNSTIFFNSSTIITNGCINITNSNITVDLSNINATNTSLILLKSTTGCVLGMPTITYLNQPEGCFTPQSEQNSNSLSIIFVPTICESNPNTKDNDSDLSLVIVLIVIGCVILLAIILIIISVLIIPIRRKIFPYALNREERNIIKLEEEKKPEGENNTVFISREQK